MSTAFSAEIELGSDSLFQRVLQHDNAALAEMPQIMHISNFWPLQMAQPETILPVFRGTSIRVLVPDLHAAAQRRPPED